MSKHYLVEGKRRFPRLAAYENPRIPADNPQETADALALLKNHWCICRIFQKIFLCSFWLLSLYVYFEPGDNAMSRFWIGQYIYFKALNTIILYIEKDTESGTERGFGMADGF